MKVLPSFHEFLENPNNAWIKIDIFRKIFPISRFIFNKIKIQALVAIQGCLR